MKYSYLLCLYPQSRLLLSILLRREYLIPYRSPPDALGTRVYALGSSNASALGLAQLLALLLRLQLDDPFSDFRIFANI